MRIEEKKQIELAKKNIKDFEPLYLAYHEKILRFCFQRMESKNEAYDVCSQVFMKAMKAIGKYQDKGFSFGSWLYRIALNEISTHYKKKTKVIKVDESFLFTLSEELEEKDEELPKRLKRELETLKPIYIQLIELRFWEGRPFKEIAEILNISEVNAKAKTYRAIEKIKTKLIKN
ncbi:MAG: RNA polymerase sigma factor [Flavobacteriales bacterium]